MKFQRTMDKRHILGDSRLVGGEKNQVIYKLKVSRQMPLKS